jgi:hypothetical protein
MVVKNQLEILTYNQLFTRVKLVSFVLDLELVQLIGNPHLSEW